MTYSISYAFSHARAPVMDVIIERISCDSFLLWGDLGLVRLDFEFWCRRIENPNAINASCYK